MFRILVVLFLLAGCSSGSSNQPNTESAGQTSGGSSTGSSSTKTADPTSFTNQGKSLIAQDEQFTYVVLQWLRALHSAKPTQADFSVEVIVAKEAASPVVIKSIELDALILRSAELKRLFVESLQREGFSGVQLNTSAGLGSAELNGMFAAFDEHAKQVQTLVEQEALKQNYEAPITVEPPKDLPALGFALSFEANGQIYALQPKWQDNLPILEVVALPSYAFSLDAKEFPQEYRTQRQAKHQEMQQNASLSPAERVNFFWLGEQLKLFEK